MRLAPVLVVAALVLGGLAWAFGNPPSGAPDELSHYVKALGVGGGELAGRSPDSRPVTGRDLANLGALLRAQPAQPGPAEAQRLAWMRRQTREFTIPPALGVNIHCVPRGSTRHTCLELLQDPEGVPYASTPMGTYPPLPYVLPGVVSQSAGNPVSAIRIGRLASAALCLALILLAAWVTARRPAGGPAALIGLVASVSPAVLMISTAINPSGPEIAGAICFAAGLLAVTRAGGRWWGAWLAVALGGLMLASSRSFGPLFAVLTVLTVAALAGRAGLRRMVAPPRWPVVAVLGIVVIASALTWIWEFTRQPHPGVGPSDVGPGIRDAASALPELAQQVVGVFGAVLDVTLPLPVYAAWALLVLGVVGLAARFGDGRERAVLVAVALASVASVALLAIAIRPTGFPVQARHVLPVVVLLPLVAGETLARHAGELPAVLVRRALPGAVCVAAAVHLAAWYANAQAWSGSSGGPGFLVSGAEWSPPGSWIVWAAALVLAAAACVAAASRAGGSPEYPGPVRPKADSTASANLRS